MSQPGTCRSCGAAVQWLTSGTTGRHVALEAEPSQDGDVMIDRNGLARELTVKLFGPIPTGGHPRFKHHKCK